MLVCAVRFLLSALSLATLALGFGELLAPSVQSAVYNFELDEYQIHSFPGNVKQYATATFCGPRTVYWKQTALDANLPFSVEDEYGDFYVSLNETEVLSWAYAVVDCDVSVEIGNSTSSARRYLLAEDSSIVVSPVKRTFDLAFAGSIPAGVESCSDFSSWASSPLNLVQYWKTNGTLTAKLYDFSFQQRFNSNPPSASITNNTQFSTTGYTHICLKNSAPLFEATLDELSINAWVCAITIRR